MRGYDSPAGSAGMKDLLLFPFAEYWWAYAAFVAFIGVVLAFDLGVFSRKAHEVSLREAIIRSVVFIAMALAFNAGLYWYMLETFPTRPDLAGLDHAKLATDTSLEFLAGYVVEYALAVDNVFVFVAVFAYFAVPVQYQQKVLFYGILGAIAFRALFISLGAILMQYHWVIVVFGAFLILTGIKILFLPEKPLDPENNPAIRLIRRAVPVTPGYHGDRFWTRIDGKTWVTPLFVALAFIEFSDIIFAIDSVPAIFALTNEPLIVFTSNIFAIMGLRSLFFVLQSMVKAFEFLKYGLGVILIFVGLKMVWLNEAFGGKFPIAWSLSIIGAILGISILVSIAYNRWNAGRGASGDEGHGAGGAAPADAAAQARSTGG
jgi:tellurite resistance protein TerC